MAAISHLPHLIASSLVNLVKDSDTHDELMKRLAAGGFKDITRIASSSPEMWEQICMTNTGNIIDMMEDYIASLKQILHSLKERQGHDIYELFETSRTYRNSILGKPPRFRYTGVCVHGRYRGRTWRNFHSVLHLKLPAASASAISVSTTTGSRVKEP